MPCFVPYASEVLSWTIYGAYTVLSLSVNVGNLLHIPYPVDNGGVERVLFHFVSKLVLPFLGDVIKRPRIRHRGRFFYRSSYFSYRSGQ